MNWRRIPHPTYGNYGGRAKKGHKYLLKPIDCLDAVFMLHNISLRDSFENKYKISKADEALFENLKKVSLLRIKRPIYGHLYWLGSLVIFGIKHHFFKPEVSK